MSSLFDFDNSQDLVFAAKTAGKQIISAKHEALTKLGAFLFLAHSDQEFALRCQMFDNDITTIANRRLATVSDSKGKLVRALHAEWSMRHATCKCAKDYDGDGKQESDAKEHAGVVHNAIQEEKGGKADGQDTTKIEASFKDTYDNLKAADSSAPKDDEPEAVNVSEPAWQRKTKSVEAAMAPAANNPAAPDSTTPAAMPAQQQAPSITAPAAITDPAQAAAPASPAAPSTKSASACPSCMGAGCENCLSGTNLPVNTSSDSEAANNMNTVPSMTASNNGDKKIECDHSMPDPITGRPSKASEWGHKFCPKCNSKIEKESSRIAHEGQNTDNFPSMIKHMTEDHGIEPLKGQSYESHTNPETIKGYHEQDHKHMTAGIKSSSSSCDCGEDSISNFNGKPSCLPGMGCQTGAQSGNCPGCGQSFHGFNVCPGGNCQSNPEQELMLKTIMKLKNEIKELMGNSNGESLETIMRHDKGHDDWHRSMGQEPCSSEEDCAAKTEEHKAMEHKSSKSKKKDKEDHYKYIKKQGDSWVITQKGTGKVLSHHDSKEQAISSFKAMMANKHGSKIAHDHPDHENEDNDFDHGHDENGDYTKGNGSITGLHLQLSGEDGNAFGILGRAQKALRRAGLHDEHWDKYHTEATSGDYNKLLATTMKYFDVD